MFDNRGIYTEGGHATESAGEAALAAARARGYDLGRQLAQEGCRTASEAIVHLGGSLASVAYSDIQAETSLFSRRDRWFRILVCDEIANNQPPRNHLLPLAVGHTLGVFVLRHGFSREMAEYPEINFGLKNTLRWGYDLQAFEAQWFGRAFAAGLLDQPWFGDPTRSAA